MLFDSKILKYAKKNLTGVLHTTLNPEGPGVVRIHLVPPKTDGKTLGASVAIINGQDIIPVNSSWTIVLAEFIKEVNKYAGKELSDADVESIINESCKGVKKVFPLVSKKLIKSDLYKIMKSFTQIAYGQPVTEHIEYLSLTDYADRMQAPHRMDLLVSAMAKDKAWNCNQKCVHCYAAGQTLAEEKELSTDEWKAIIDKCKEACIPQLTFTGGEPTMRDDLVELIDYSQWFVTRLNTNGIKLTKELCQKLFAASLDSMQITFYSNDPAIHNQLVGAERYSDTVAGIENALEAGLNISINTPLCSLNKDYKRTLEFLHEKGVTYVTCSGLIITGNATLEKSTALQLSKDEIKAVLKEAAEYCYANGMEISFTSPGWVEAEFCKELGLTVPSCGACLSNMAITPAGNVVPCQSWLSDAPLGNMLTDTWADIWNNPVSAERREFSSKMLGVCPFREKNGENEGGCYENC